MDIFSHWQLTQAEINEVIEQNPSLRGMMLGYVSEFMLKKLWFTNQRFQQVKKEDDHDRKQKGDLWATYKGVRISLEVKSLQTNSVRHLGEDNYKGTFQCDASDRRLVTLPNGDALETTCLIVGEFDLVAVGLFEFGQQWRFAFAKNIDLPRSKGRKYTEEQRVHLLKSSMAITWPLQAPFEAEPFRLLDELVAEKQAGMDDRLLEGVNIESVDEQED
jgi:hypothetical protein